LQLLPKLWDAEQRLGELHAEAFHYRKARIKWNAGRQLYRDDYWDRPRHSALNHCAADRELKRSANVRRFTQDGRELRRYCRRWKIERLFAWLHNFRRLVSSWEYHEPNFLAMLQLGCLVILLRHL
jgi:transposase